MFFLIFYSCLHFLTKMFAILYQQYDRRKNGRELPLKYYIENPVGKMQWYLQVGTLFGKIPRLVTIDQCQYGRDFQKRTHIFTNDFTWKERGRCPGRPLCNHTPNIKSEKQGNGSRYYRRALIPRDLCLEILKNQ